MKTHPYFKFLLLFAALALMTFACSKKEDPYVEQVPALTLLLTSDAGNEELQVLRANDSVNFTVTGSDGVNYTSGAKIFVNNTEIANGFYIFSELGEYTVKATYDDISSNALSFQVLAPTERALTIDVPKALRNQTVTFGLLDSQGNNTAAEATFYVDDTAISGYTYSSANPASLMVRAEYEIDNEMFSTENKPFEIFIPKRKVVVEDYTGTWCGFCPAVALAIDTLRANTPHVSIVAIHKTAASQPDPLHFDRIEDLQAMFNVSNGFPRGQINRTVAWPDPYPKNQVLAMAGTDSDVSIGVKSQLNGSNLSVGVKVVYENGSTPGDKVVVYLLESGVVAPQANYFNETPGHPYEGLGNPIDEYVHNDGLRNSLSDLFGDAIPSTPAFQEYRKNYTFSIPSTYVGSNLSFVVMIVDANNNAKNSQFANINETKSYE